MYRLAGPLPALTVLVFDLSKGLLPVLWAMHLGLDHTATALIALSACLGHIYPVFFGFRGGKGVATALGCIIALDWVVAFGVVGIWVCVYSLCRYASVAALCASGAAPLLSWWLAPQLTLPIGFISVLIALRHSSNIRRLWQGSEPKT